MQEEGRSIRARAPGASSEAVRERMRAVPSNGTGPEMAVRKALHAVGLRYRVNLRPEEDLRCRADVVFTRQQVCIFVDGCFWHGCPEHFQRPNTNSKWWDEKIGATKERDRRQNQSLRKRGWHVVRIWEHDTATKRGLQGIVNDVRRALSQTTMSRTVSE